MPCNVITFIVNNHTVTPEEQHLDWSLSRYLRDVIGLTGTKQSCDSEGTCGACTVIINGKAKRSCLIKVRTLENARIETIENLQVEDNEIPHPIIQTVVQDGIFQCGYCSSGAILAAKALLDENKTPSDKEIEKVLSSVICRCAGLHRMDLSVKRAAAILRGDEKSTWTVEDNLNESRILSRVTGKQKYSADLSFPKMLYGKAVRANVPHARVINVDTREALEMPGIIGVLTAKDIPGMNIFGAIIEDQPIFCDENNPVRYVGEALALVIGETPEQVAEAVEKVKTELELLPVVSSVDEAVTENAPIIHERLKDQRLDHPNVLKHFKTRKGDIKAGFKEADVIVEGDYQLPFIEHAYMEVECSIAVPEADGSITVYCGSQGPVEDQRQVAKALGMDLERIRIAHVFMGGGFGGKDDIAGQIHAALAAVKTGRIVKVQWSRSESLMVSCKRHAVKMHYKVGAKQNGKLVAAEVKVLGDTGPYTSTGEAVLFRTNVFACGPYVVPNVHVDAYGVLTNNVIGGAFRGYGTPQVAFGAELTMQKLADRLGMDAVEFRLINALDIGDATSTGDVITKDVGVGIKACLNAVKGEMEKTGILQLMPDEKLGIGVAAGYKNVGFGSDTKDCAGAEVSLEEDGFFLVRHGATDMGQGVNDIIATVAARVLGVPKKMVRVHTADTKFDPPGGMTTASRQTFITGNATLQASQNLREKIMKAVAEEFLVPAAELTFEDGKVINLITRQAYISLSELAHPRQHFTCNVTYHAPRTQPMPEKALSYPKETDAPLHFAYDYGAQAAYVAVNEKTGDLRVLKIIAAHDVGIAISPKNIIGQIEGGVIQGVGYALSEDFPMRNGMPVYRKFNDLGLLRFRDLPQIVPIIVEEAHPKGPFGAKGMGELTITPTAPAIVNAVHDAVGVWIDSLPITREKLINAIRAKGR